MRRFAILSCVTALALNAEVFTLGKVEVTAQKEGRESDSSVVSLSSEKLQKDEIKRLSEVAFRNAGIYVDKKGARAEQNFYVRGFDARRVPLFIDGIPVYNPYDGNSDFGRFTTFDVAQIDISKGASSVLYGQNTMGGAINLVTKKPTKAFEGSLDYGFESGRSARTMGNSIAFSLGSKQESFYVQASGSFMEDQGQQLSSDFKDRANIGNEDGNRRDHSVQRDKKFSLRLGITPNESDEYSLSYTNQKGMKEGADYTGRYKKNRLAKRYWDWPSWDKDSLYFLSHTQLGGAYVKSKIFHDTYQNELRSYDDKARTKQTGKSGFNSHYDDRSIGAGIELGGAISERDMLKFASNYKFDEHKEHNDGEPKQTYQDRNYTFVLEYTNNLSDHTTLVLGGGYDVRDAIKAQDYGKPRGGGADRLFDFDVKKQDAFNYQALVQHSFDGNDMLRVSFAKKSYFASMKERYSERFKKYIPNPGLKPEVAYHYEIGYERDINDSFHLSLSLYQSDIKDAIKDVLTGIKEAGAELAQSRNIQKATYQGGELEAVYKAGDSLEFGGNYSYIYAQFKGQEDRLIHNLPKHKGYLYTEYKISQNTGIHLASVMFSDILSKSEETTRLPGFALFDVKATHSLSKEFSLEAGIRNLFDKFYEFQEGYPEEGRVFFGNLRYRF